MQLFKKGFHSHYSIPESKGTLDTVITVSDYAPAKVVTVWPWHYNEPAL